MALFSRKKKDEVPAEIQEYYQAERRERVGVAWLVALVTLLITVAVVLGLFFGGRWLYNKLANRDRQTATTGQNETATSQENQPANGDDKKQEGNSSNPTQPNPSPAPPSSNPPSPAPQPSSPAPAPNPSPSPGSAPSSAPNPATPNPTTPPPTSSTTTSTPNSGPGDVVAIFAATTILGTIAHRLYLSRRSDHINS